MKVSGMQEKGAPIKQFDFSTQRNGASPMSARLRTRNRKIADTELL
jgi:hypothetical protein